MCEALRRLFKWLFMSDLHFYLGIAAFIVVVIIVVTLFNKAMAKCPGCGEKWERTGEVKQDGMWAGRSAFKEEWRCPHCGLTAWIPKSVFKR